MGALKAFLRSRSADADAFVRIQDGLRAGGWATPEEHERLRDALDHIKKTAHHSRTQTRRLRWISNRADLALKGENFTYDATEEPVRAPSFAAMDHQLRYTRRLLAEMTEERDRAYEMGQQAFIGMQCAETQLKEARLDERQAMTYLQQAREALGYEGDFPSMIKAIRENHPGSLRVKTYE